MCTQINEGLYLKREEREKLGEVRGTSISTSLQLFHDHWSPHPQPEVNMRLVAYVVEGLHFTLS